MGDPTAFNDTYVFSEGVWRYSIDDLPVRNAITVTRGAVTTLIAPELMPDRLLTSRGAAVFLGLSYETIRTYRSDGILPPPVITLNNSPLWSRPVLRAWYKNRPGQGCGERPSRTAPEFNKWKKARANASV